MNRLKKGVSLLVLVASWLVVVAVAAASLYQGGTAGWSSLSPEKVSAPLRHWWQKRQQLVRLLETEELGRFPLKRQHEVLEQLLETMRTVPLRPPGWQTLSKPRRKQLRENLALLLALHVIEQARDYARQDTDDRSRVLRRAARWIHRYWLPVFSAAVAFQGREPLPPELLAQQELVQQLAWGLQQQMQHVSWTERLQVGLFLVQLRGELQRRLGRSVRLPAPMPSELPSPPSR